jgi:hypothetical protein
MQTEFLRRPKRIPLLEIDVQAVALAHHRYFCQRPDREVCDQVDQDDLDYAEQMAEIMAMLPGRPR